MKKDPTTAPRKSRGFSVIAIPRNANAHSTSNARCLLFIHYMSIRLDIFMFRYIDNTSRPMRAKCQLSEE